MYSRQESPFPSISPLHIRKAVGPPPRSNVLQSYTKWEEERAASKYHRDISPPRARDTDAATKAEHPSTMATAEGKLQVSYSPLTPFFSTKDMPASKTATKTMIGDNGWLERTVTGAEEKSTPAKKVGFLGNLKKMAKEMVRGCLVYLDQGQGILAN
jgi:hypothetical protein